MVSSIKKLAIFKCTRIVHGAERKAESSELKARQVIE